MYLVLGLSR